MYVVIIICNPSLFVTDKFANILLIARSPIIKLFNSATIFVMCVCVCVCVCVCLGRIFPAMKTNVTSTSQHDFMSYVGRPYLVYCDSHTNLD